MYNASLATFSPVGITSSDRLDEVRAVRRLPCSLQGDELHARVTYTDSEPTDPYRVSYPMPEIFKIGTWDLVLQGHEFDRTGYCQVITNVEGGRLPAFDSTFFSFPDEHSHARFSCPTLARVVHCKYEDRWGLAVEQVRLEVDDSSITVVREVLDDTGPRYIHPYVSLAPWRLRKFSDAVTALYERMECIGCHSKSHYHS